MSRSAGLNIFLSLLAFTLIGCSRDGGDRITVVAASSLQETLEELSADWTAVSGFDIDISYAGSQTLAAQLLGGLPADVAIVANVGIIEELRSAGSLAATPIPIASTSVVLAFRPEVAVVTMGELASSRLILVLADPAVPLGEYSREAIVRAGLSPDDLHPVSLETSASATVTRLRTGDADVALIYAPDGDGFNVVTIDSPRVVYLAARIVGARDGADEFIDFLLSADGSAGLTAFGFNTP